MPIQPPLHEIQSSILLDSMGIRYVKSELIESMQNVLESDLDNLNARVPLETSILAKISEWTHSD